MRRRVVALLVCGLLGSALYAQQPQGSQLRWSFARSQGAAPVDNMQRVKASVGGSYTYVAGVSGDGLRFDGYTTGMTVPMSSVRALGRGGFTVQAWVALNTYPWNWVPIVDQEEVRQEGFLLGRLPSTANGKASSPRQPFRSRSGRTSQALMRPAMAMAC